MLVLSEIFSSFKQDFQGNLGLVSVEKRNIFSLTLVMRIPWWLISLDGHFMVFKAWLGFTLSLLQDTRTTRLVGSWRKSWGFFNCNFMHTYTGHLYSAISWRSQRLYQLVHQTFSLHSLLGHWKYNSWDWWMAVKLIPDLNVNDLGLNKDLWFEHYQCQCVSCPWARCFFPRGMQSSEVELRTHGPKVMSSDPVCAYGVLK